MSDMVRQDRRLTVRIPGEVLDRIMMAAEAERRTVSAWVVGKLETVVGGEKPDERLPASSGRRPRSRTEKDSAFSGQAARLARSGGSGDEGVAPLPSRVANIPDVGNVPATADHMADVTKMVTTGVTPSVAVRCSKHKAVNCGRCG